MHFRERVIFLKWVSTVDGALWIVCLWKISLLVFWYHPVKARHNRKTKTRNYTVNFCQHAQPPAHSPQPTCVMSRFHHTTGGCVRAAALAWPRANCTALHYLSCLPLCRSCRLWNSGLRTQCCHSRELTFQLNYSIQSAGVRSCSHPSVDAHAAELNKSLIKDVPTVCR